MKLLKEITAKDDFDTRYEALKLKVDDDPKEIYKK